MRKSTPDWNIWQTVFLVPIIVVNLNHGQPIDAAHAHNAAIFRLIVTLVCLVGSTVLFLMRRNAALTPPDARPVSADGPTIGITYQSTPDASRRAERYVLFHQPMCLIMISVLGLTMAFLMADRLFKVSPAAAYIAFPPMWIAGSAAWTALLWFTVCAQIQQRFPRPDTVRICTTSLMPDGVADQTPDKLTIIQWNKLIAVREHEGDIFFWTTPGQGCYIPRHAFPTPDAQQRFYSTALSLWKNKGANWDQVTGIPHATLVR